MTFFKLKTLYAVAMCVTLAGGGFGVVAIQADDKKPAQPGEKPAVKPGEKPGEKPPVKPGEKPAAKDGEKPKPANPDGEKPVKPGAKPDKGGLKFGGKVASVDAKENTIMLAIKGDGGIVEKMYPVAKDAKITVDGKDANLADVPKNSTAAFAASAQKDGQLPVISELRVSGATISGTIKTVDAANIALENEKKPQEFKITGDTKVTVNGKDAKAADLKAGDKVVIQLKADETAAPTISSGVKVGDGEKPGVKPVKNPTFGGKISSVDAKANTISLAGKGEGGQEILVKLTADAKITVDGKEVKLDAVPKGAYATLSLVSAKDGQPREANVLVVGGMTFGGSVKQIDASTITIGNEKTDRVLKLTQNTKVTINGKDVKVADLKTGDRVMVTISSDDASALSITVGGKKPEGDKPKPEKEEEDE